MKKSDVFRMAADVLKAGGLCKGEYQNGRGQHCVLGAMSRVVDGSTNEEFAELTAAVRLTAGIVTDPGLPKWNDAPERTADEVIIAMDAAYIVALQEEGIEPGDVLR